MPAWGLQMNTRGKKMYERTAIIEADIENLKQDIKVPDGYKRTLIIFRYRERVIGKKIFPSSGGMISLIDALDYAESLSREIYDADKCRMEAGQTDNWEPFVSVIVCTRNRTDDLRSCLESLTETDYANKEIVVVDNAPDDDKTKVLVSLFKDVRYIHEPCKGLDTARNTGLKSARGEIAAFTDDDACADRSWLKSLVRNFSNPVTAIVTGITLPAELETEAQLYFEKTNGFDRNFLRRVFDVCSINPVAAGRAGAGVNMAIRMSVLRETGLFDEALDCGTLSLSGGDQEFFYRAMIRGYRIIYEPSALVWHRHRRDTASLESTVFGYGAGVFAWWTRALLAEKEFKLLLLAPKWLLVYNIKNLISSLFNSGDKLGRRLAFAEFKGALQGPFRYLSARRYIRSRSITDKVIEKPAGMYTAQEHE